MIQFGTPDSRSEYDQYLSIFDYHATHKNIPSSIIFIAAVFLYKSNLANTLW